jgi:hypothetical protein
MDYNVTVISELGYYLETLPNGANIYTNKNVFKYVHGDKVIPLYCKSYKFHNRMIYFIQDKKLRKLDTKTLQITDLFTVDLEIAYISKVNSDLGLFKISNKIFDRTGKFINIYDDLDTGTYISHFIVCYNSKIIIVAHIQEEIIEKRKMFNPTISVHSFPNYDKIYESKSNVSYAWGVSSIEQIDNHIMGVIALNYITQDAKKCIKNIKVRIKNTCKIIDEDTILIENLMLRINSFTADESFECGVCYDTVFTKQKNPFSCYHDSDIYHYDCVKTLKCCPTCRAAKN